jgi:hypothetical protein
MENIAQPIEQAPASENIFAQKERAQLDSQYHPENLFRKRCAGIMPSAA